MEYTLFYKTREFVSLTKKELLTDEELIAACKEMAEGLYDADLGGNVYKNVSLQVVRESVQVTGS